MTRVYGDLRWDELDRETELGLFLNLGREEIRQAADIAAGIGIAFNEHPGNEYFRAISHDDMEAEALRNIHEVRLKHMAETRNR